jgi:signal transduction histidine kinase
MNMGKILAFRAANIGRAGTNVAFATVAIGYLYGVLTSTHLQVWAFLLYTVLHFLYCLLVWWIKDEIIQVPWRRYALVGVFLLLASTIGALAFAGLGWNWLVYLVSVSLSLFLLPLWAAIGASILLYGNLLWTLFLLNDGHVMQMYGGAFQLLAAFLFVMTFSHFLQKQERQRVKAEQLLAQLEKSNGDLEKAHWQLQKYAQEVEELAVVHERNRLAREIHDTLGHHLSILNIQLETINRLRERDPARLEAEIAEARRVAGQAMQEVRNAVVALRPASIAQLTLPQALEQLAREFRRTQPETELALDLETELPILVLEVQVALYRTTQEALTNVRKHARASKVLVRLRYDERQLELLVLDNGIGAITGESSGQEAEPHEQIHGGFGLLGLRERVALLGGNLQTETTDAGFRVCVQVPVSEIAEIA